MKDKTIIALMSVGVIIFVLFMQIMIWNRTPSLDEQLLKKIDNLELKLDSISAKKDSIQTIVVEIERTIDKTNKNHEKVVNTILNNDDSANYAWAKRYIEEYRLKHSK